MTNIYNLEINDELTTVRLSVDVRGPGDMRESPMDSHILTDAILLLLEQADVAEWEDHEDEMDGLSFFDLIYRAVEDLEVAWNQRHSPLVDEI